jgi:hypothetical protein
MGLSGFFGMLPSGREFTVINENPDLGIKRRFSVEGLDGMRLFFGILGVDGEMFKDYVEGGR